MIELACHVCGRLHAVSRADMLRLPPATYRACPSCREAAPIAPCTVAWSDRGRFWSVVFPRCPLCGGKHAYGGGDGAEPDLGHRMARPGSYELVETEDSRTERARLRAKREAA